MLQRLPTPGLELEDGLEAMEGIKLILEKSEVVVAGPGAIVLQVVRHREIVMWVVKEERVIFLMVRKWLRCVHAPCPMDLQNVCFIVGVHVT